jgi:hypothetical protein
MMDGGLSASAARAQGARISRICRASSMPKLTASAGVTDVKVWSFFKRG